jgi:hypothetical protein
MRNNGGRNGNCVADFRPNRIDILDESMTIREEPTIKTPFIYQPGRCPVCGVEIRPRENEVFQNGLWDGRTETGEPAGGGLVYETNCSGCGFLLYTGLTGIWANVDLLVLLWYPCAEKRLAGGNRYGGRPGAWTPDTIPQIEKRFQELLAQSKSLDEAIVTLHLTTGIGGLQIIGLVERFVGLSKLEAKQRVVQALAPKRDEGT